MLDLKNNAKLDFRSNGVLDTLLDQYIFRNKINFYERGFVLLSENMMFYDKNHLFLSGLPKNYFRELLKANINPDNIEVLYENILNDDVESFIQRCNVTQGHTKIYTSNFQKIDFAAGHYEKKGYGILNLSNDPIKLKDTEVFILPELNQICFKSKAPLEILPEIDFYYTPQEILKLQQKERFRNFSQFNKAISAAEQIQPEKFKAEINIIPNNFNLKKLTTEGKIYLVYSRDKDSNLSNFQENNGIYKCFPFIDYRFSKTFTEDRHLVYCIELYLSKIIMYRDMIIDRGYKAITKIIEDAVYQYIEKNTDFKQTLVDLLDCSKNVSLPKNRYEYILLHNTIEFVQFIYDVLIKNDFIGIDFVEKIIQTLNDLKIRSRDIEIGSHDLKGNINLFMSGKRYLFYSISEDDLSIHIPRQYEIPLQDGPADSRDMMEKVQKKAKATLKAFKKDIGAADVFASLEREFYVRAAFLKDLHHHFDQEKGRLADIFQFLAAFKKATIKKQTQLYVHLKREFFPESQDNYNDDFYASLMGGLEDMDFPMPRRFKKRKKKQHKKKKMLATFGTIIGLMLFSFFLFNLGVWLNEKRSVGVEKQFKTSFSFTLHCR